MANNDDDDFDNDKDPLDDALGINGRPAVSQFSSAIETIVGMARNDSAGEDFTFARANIREIIETGNDAISKLSVLAEQSQNNRAYESLAKLMDTLIVANKELLEIQKKIRDLDQIDKPRDKEANVVTNNLYVGSTAELAAVLKEMKQNEQQ